MINKKQLSILVLLILSANLFSENLKQVTYASWDKPDVELFYYLPKTINQDTGVLFIIHGASRDAERYIKIWENNIVDKNVILIAPKFSKNSFPNYALLEMATSSGKVKKDETKYLTNSLSVFFTYFKNKYNLGTDLYSIYGFSGGSQFTHRYLMYSNDQRLHKAAIGSAGWYTFINNDPFPYGTQNMSIDEDRLEWLLRSRILFLLGEQDTDPNHATLNSSNGAINQGSNRYERGKNYFDNMIHISKKNNLPFRWRYKLVKDVDHNMDNMTYHAMEFLLDDFEYIY